MMRAAILLTLASTAAALPTNLHDRAYYEEKFFNWVKEHKIHAQNGEHFVHMLQNFANNDDLIETHNTHAQAGKYTYTLGHNQFSHLSVEEWRQYVHLGLSRPATASTAAAVHTAPANLSDLPAAVDWRSKGAVTPVMNQKQCGSCWAFSATGALEGAYFNKYGKLESFSEEYLVDCDNRDYGGKDLGCKGGLMNNAFDWISKNGGICREEDYPYIAGDLQVAGSCWISACTKVPGSKIEKHVDVEKNSDAALLSAIAQQPVSVAIEADQSAFQLYKSGVFSGPCGAKLDHGVLVVGYGTEDGLDYYLVKNSWGTTWGDAGYIKLVRGAVVNDVQKEGQCGILSGPPSYPVL